MTNLTRFQAKRKQCVKKVKQLLSNGGFNLTKSSSNNQDILKPLSSTNIVKSTDINLDLDEIIMEWALGVLWQPEKDTLKIKSVEKKLPAMKREILIFISTIFDPLGFLAPAVLEPKLIMQELWKRNIEWDEDVPDDVAQRWSKWQATQPNLSKLRSPVGTILTFQQKNPLSYMFLLMHHQLLMELFHFYE